MMLLVIRVGMMTILMPLLFWGPCGGGVGGDDGGIRRFGDGVVVFSGYW